MEHLKLKDLGAHLLVAAVAVPYIGYLARGEMPLIEDPRGHLGHRPRPPCSRLRRDVARRHVRPNRARLRQPWR